MKEKFEYGEPIIYIPENKQYDFGYYSSTEGYCVIYLPGERNMQDSIAVKIENIKSYDL